MRNSGILYITAAAALTLCIAAPAQAQNPLSRAERIICKSLNHCLDITARHNPQSYDYAALHQDYLRFGEKAKIALLGQLGSDKPVTAMRAQTLLAKGGFRYSPEQQRKIAALWPSQNPKLHKNIMLSAPSALMRARAIETLSHKDPVVRAGAQDIIFAALSAKIQAPLSERDISALSRAALLYPSPVIADLLGTLDKARARPALLDLLKSGDGPSVIAAYDKLHSADPASAFKGLLSTLRGLENSEKGAQAAFGISQLLRHRHQNRQDGFYLNFAKGLSEDSQMSLMGRGAGLDALLQSSELNPAQRMDTTKTQKVFGVILPYHETVPHNYIRNFAELGFENPDSWIGPLAKALEAKPDQQARIHPEFIAALGNFKTAQAKALTAKALGHQADFNMSIAAILASRQQGQDISARLKPWSQSHPISLVRATAHLALAQDKRLKNQSAYRTYLALKTSTPANTAPVNRPDEYCAIGKTDFKGQAKALPFFEGGAIGEIAVTRGALSAATPLKEGWLAGYDKGASYGGLIYYDYATESSRNLLDKNIHALAPAIDVPLGQFSRDFWAVTAAKDNAAIYRIIPQGPNIAVRRHAVLPAAPSKIERLKDGSLVLGFAPNGAKARKPALVNPPLRLFANGAINLACQKEQSTPQKALP